MVGYEYDIKKDETAPRAISGHSVIEFTGLCASRAIITHFGSAFSPAFAEAGGFFVVSPRQWLG
jgi:hypothetical protein